MDYLNALGDDIIEWSTVGSAVTNAPTKGWPLGGFGEAVAIVVAYWTFVAVGSLVMSQTPGDGYKLYPVSFCYNIIQVMLCSYMCIEAGFLAVRSGYSLTPCNTFSATNPPVANILWLFYISKVLDFMDTVFIVLGKRWKQLSFLHVYHHSTIFLFYWLNLNVNYDGDIFLTVILNGLIHTVMYTYYFVSLHTKDIWWKKYLTAAQLLQFICMMAQATYLVSSGCQACPPRVTMAYFLYILSLFGLFAQFFVQSYMRPPPRSGKGKKSE